MASRIDTAVRHALLALLLSCAPALSPAQEIVLEPTRLSAHCWYLEEEELRSAKP